MHHQWSNYCLYCHVEAYEPAAVHGLRLWHYCVNCVAKCVECGQEKPLYAFQYDKGTEAYNRYRAGLRSTPSGALNRAPKEAHYPFCSSCQMRRVDILEAKKNEQLEAQREEEIRQQKKMLQSQGAKSALDAILKNLS